MEYYSKKENEQKMKKCFYLTLIVMAFSFSTHCFALTDLLAHSKDRSAAFNGSAVDRDVVVGTHTLIVNSILNDQSKISERCAGDLEKESILKAVITGRIMHMNDELYLLPSHGLKKGDKFFEHYEILSLASELSGDLMNRFCGSGYDKGTLDSYESRMFDTLYAYSGIKKDVFKRWLYEVFETHRTSFEVLYPSGPVVPRPARLSNSCGELNKCFYQGLPNSTTTQLRDEFAKAIVLVHEVLKGLPEEGRVIKSAKIKEINDYIQSQIFDPTSFRPDYRNTYIHPMNYGEISVHEERGDHISYDLNLSKMPNGALEALLSLQVEKKIFQKSGSMLSKYKASFGLVNVIYPSIPAEVAPKAPAANPPQQSKSDVVATRPVSERTTAASAFGPTIYGSPLVGSLPYYRRR